jgi:hypothetical protein
MIRYERHGAEWMRETIHTDPRGFAISKTSAVRPSSLVVGSTNSPTERRYERGRWGFVYRPVHSGAEEVFNSTDSDRTNVFPGRFAWRWADTNWFGQFASYWVPDETYSTSSRWAADWMIASILADHFLAGVSETEAREEARLAREDARKASEVAGQAKNQAEMMEARAAQAEAEARAARADAKESKTASNASGAVIEARKAGLTPISPSLKARLAAQIERAGARRKRFSAPASLGKDSLPDLAESLSEPETLYPVARAVSVTRAEDGQPAGLLTAGDLLELERGQEQTWRSANENALVTMRVLASKGEEGETLGGTRVAVALRDLQDFENEFNAKLDLAADEWSRHKEATRAAASR